MSKKLFYYGSTASFLNLYSNSMDGVNEYATCGNASKIIYEYANNFSFSCWVKMNNILGVLSGLLTYNDSVLPSANGWMVVNQLGVFRFYINAATFIAANAAVTAGVWTHVLCTFSTTRFMQMYVDGVLQTATNTSGAITYNAINHNIIRIGNYADLRYCNGKIAHPAIFNKELSAAEATELYNKKMGSYATLSFSANLTAAWKYNLGIADYPTWTDYVGGINATMTNQENTDIDADVPV